MRKKIRADIAGIISLIFLATVSFAGDGLAGYAVNEYPAEGYCTHEGLNRKTYEEISSVRWEILPGGTRMRLEVTAHISGSGYYFEYVNAYADWDGDGKFGNETGQTCPNVSGEPLTRPEVQTGREEEHVMSQSVFGSLADADGNITFTGEFDIHRYENVGDTYVRINLSGPGNTCNPCRETYVWGDVWDVWVRISPGGGYPRSGNTYHSADYNPADFRIGLSELLRVIQFYNSDGFHCDADSEDGYASEKGDVRGCTRHDSDYNKKYWKIGLSELLRLIQLYNCDGYHSDPNGEDGFSPGKKLSLSIQRMYADDARQEENKDGDRTRSEEEQEGGEDEESENGITVSKVSGDLIEIVHEISNSEDTRQKIVLSVRVPDDWTFRKCHTRNDSGGSGYEELTGACEHTDDGKQTCGFYMDIPAGVTMQAAVRFNIGSDGTVSSEISSKYGIPLDTAEMENEISVTDDPKEVIVTNRDNLYEIYDDDQVTELLRTLSEIADSKENGDGRKDAVIYYADWYEGLTDAQGDVIIPEGTFTEWNNRDCEAIYAAEMCSRLDGRKFRDEEENPEVNRGAIMLENLIKRWTEKTDAEYLLIVGGDEILPFYRLYDLGENSPPGYGLFTPLVMNRYFSDTFFHEDHEIYDTFFEWGQMTDNGMIYHREHISFPVISGPAHSVSHGRIVGASVSDMLSLINKGLSGPGGEDNVILASTGDGVVQHLNEELADVFTARKLTVNRRDEETVFPLIANDSWRCQDFIEAVNRGAKYVIEGSHSYPDLFKTLGQGEDCGTDDLDRLHDSQGYFVAMLGCFAGAVKERSDDHTSCLAYEFIHKGACGYFGSYPMVYSNDKRNSEAVYGAELFDLFIRILMTEAPSVTVGEAFGKAVSEYGKADWKDWAGTVPRGDVGYEYPYHRTLMQFHLYGLPWMEPAFPEPDRRRTEISPRRDEKDRIGKSGPTGLRKRTAAGSAARSGGTFARTLTFSVTDYDISQEDAFDLVSIPGARFRYSSFRPVVSYFTTELTLPEGASVLSAEVTGGSTRSLGQLNLPIFYIPEEPDASQFTEFTYFTGLYPDPACSWRTVPYTNHTEVLIDFSPVQHNVDTKETTLWTEATVEVRYEVEECIFISDLRTDKESYKSNEPVIVTATVNNVGDTDVTGLTAAGSLKKNGEVQRSAQAPVGTVPAGGSTEVTVSIGNGLSSETYFPVIEIRDENDALADSLMEEAFWITSDEITDFALSGEDTLFSAGDRIPFRFACQNYSPNPLEGLLTVKISGSPETREAVTERLSVPGESPGEFVVHGDTQCLEPGEYRAWAVFEPDGRREQYSGKVFFTITAGGLNCDFGSDTDGDGWSDGLESGLGSDLLNGQSYPVRSPLLVTDESGNPVPGAEVWMTVGSGKFFQGETGPDGRIGIPAAGGITVEAYWHGRKASLETGGAEPEYSLILPLLSENDPPGIVVRVGSDDPFPDRIPVTVSGDPLTAEPEVILSRRHTHSVPVTSRDGGPWSGDFAADNNGSGVLEISASAASGMNRSVTSFRSGYVSLDFAEYAFRIGGTSESKLYGTFPGGELLISEGFVPAPANGGLVQVGNVLGIEIPYIDRLDSSVYVTTELSEARLTGTDRSRTTLFGWNAEDNVWEAAGGEFTPPFSFGAILGIPRHKTYTLFAPPSDDTVPPDPVTELRGGTGGWPGGIILHWRIPEDNEAVYMYKIYYSETTVTDPDSCSHTHGFPWYDGGPGTEEAFTFEMPARGRDYYFAVRAGDVAGNWSAATYLNIPTKSYMQDNDGDGMSDTWEWEYDLDQSSDDSRDDADRDGLTNGEEFVCETNPRSSDTDGDGHPDSEEVSLGTDPLDPDSYPRPPGDLDCDSAVTLADALIALRLAASENTPPRFCLSDADGDGKVGLADAVFILQKIVVPE